MVSPHHHGNRTRLRVNNVPHPSRSDVQEILSGGHLTRVGVDDDRRRRSAPQRPPQELIAGGVDVDHHRHVGHDYIRQRCRFQFHTDG